jgi:hypothetical protein
MKLIRETWGPIAPQNVIFATTKWDQINEEELDNVREVERSEIYWKGVVPDSSQITRFLHTHESAWSIVDRFISNRWVLQLQVGRGMDSSSFTTSTQDEDAHATQRLEEYRRPERLLQILSESNKLLVNARRPLPGEPSPENVERSQTTNPNPSDATVSTGVGSIWMGRSRHSHHGSIRSKLSSLASSMTSLSLHSSPPENSSAMRFEDAPEHAEGSTSDPQ